MSSPVSTLEGRNYTANGLAELVTTNEVSYSVFKNTILTLHKHRTAGAETGDFESLSLGMRLLNEWGNLFPSYAAQLADDPAFLS